MTAMIRIFLVALGVFALPLQAQPKTRASLDSTSARCLDVTWLDARAVCEGRAGNAAALGLLGGMTGALSGIVGGALLPSACLGTAGAAAGRGAALGAGLGLVAGMLTPHVSRRVLAARHDSLRARVQTNTRAWSWRDVRPAMVVIGGTALGGAAIGAVRGASSPVCTGGAGANAIRGAGVYGAGTVATMGTALLAVRWLF